MTLCRALKRGRRKRAGATLRTQSAASIASAPPRRRRAAARARKVCTSNSEWSLKASTSCTKRCSSKWKFSSGPTASGCWLKCSDSAPRRGLQRLREGVGHGVEHGVGRGCVDRPVPRPPAPGVRSARAPRAGAVCARRADLAQAQLGAVHLPRALDQVVRLVDQHGQLPVQRLRQAPELAVACRTGGARRPPARRPSAPVPVPGSRGRCRGAARRGAGPAASSQPSGHGLARARRAAGRRSRGPAGRRRRGRPCPGVRRPASLGTIVSTRSAWPGGAGAQAAQRLQRREPARALAGQVGDLVDALRRAWRAAAGTACPRSCRCRWAPGPAGSARWRPCR